ncbi:MAG: hypothetical protein LUE31_08535 [Lachnospiraceae bacterium]|nr:hypothetical protein [Lachnospiraceae bacterium]
MSKRVNNAPVTINIESLSFNFGDCHSTTFYSPDTDDLELDFDDVAEDEELTEIDSEDYVESEDDVEESEETCDCGCDFCKAERESDIKHISKMPKKDKEFLKFVLEAVIDELK